MGIIGLILDLFNRYRLPLHRNDRNISDFLQDHFYSYKSEISKIILCKELLPKSQKSMNTKIERCQGQINILCDSIVDSINTYLDGDPLQAYQVLFKTLDKLNNGFSSFDINEYKYYPYHEGLFRIRNLQNNEKISSRKELFHVPFEDNKKVKAYRYSIAGFPCLYLGSDQYICWLENQMPSKFAYSKLIFSSDKSFSLLDFRFSPYAYRLSFGAKPITNQFTKNDLQNIVNYLLTYPLLAACSIAVEEKDCSFKVEYIIPQILMAWIRQSKNYRGIAYFSCSGYPNASHSNAHNVVIAPISTNKFGYCKELSQVFKLTDPISINITKHFLDDKFLPAKNDILNIRNLIYKEYTQNRFDLSLLDGIIENLDYLLILRKQVCSDSKSSFYETELILSIIEKNLRKFVENKNIINRIRIQNKVLVTNHRKEWENLRKVLKEIIKEITSINNCIYRLSSVIGIIMKDDFKPDDFKFISEDIIEKLTP